MSTDEDLAVAGAEALPAVAEKCCASCGFAENDDMKLKPCSKCDVDQCQKEQVEKVEDACKQWAAELNDELLFKQPESSHLGDCPICFLPMPLDQDESRINICCCQRVCIGCIHANMIREIIEGHEEHRCPFCRQIAPRTGEESQKHCIERAKSNDPIAFAGLVMINYEKGNHAKAFEYASRAAALGDADSMFNLSLMYRYGEGVEVNKANERALLEKAAIAGHAEARHNLGCIEANNGNFGRAVKHWSIAAALGCDQSIKTLMYYCKDGLVRKEDYATALRAYQAAVDAMKSPQRQVAAVNSIDF